MNYLVTDMNDEQLQVALCDMLGLTPVGAWHNKKGFENIQYSWLHGRRTKEPARKIHSLGGGMVSLYALHRLAKTHKMLVSFSDMCEASIKLPSPERDEVVISHMCSNAYRAIGMCLLLKWQYLQEAEGWNLSSLPLEQNLRPNWCSIY